MRISVITPNFNGERFLDESLQSVIAQREAGVDLEYIVVDGNSADRSMDIIRRYGSAIDRVICENDAGPASAINKGFRAATGDVVGWLNADDAYRPGALVRVVKSFEANPGRAICFGRCPIIDEDGREIRTGITRFKEMFFPISCRFTIQCINYISQPAMFFRRSALEKAGPLREDLKCAWDYEFILRLWRHGGAMAVPEPALAAFRWHGGSISGRNYAIQFREEWAAAAADSGRFSPQAMLHLGVRWGIVWSYSLMAWRRRRQKDRADRS